MQRHSRGPRSRDTHRHERAYGRESGRQLLRLEGAAKRLLDIGIAGAALLFLAPFLLVIALVVKLDSRGPAFYHCIRVGLRGREFRMLKLRKMRHGATGVPLTLPDDERFTRVGRFLARTRLDELPQLWNVLKGDMSLVGPRPEDPVFVALHRSAYATILSLRPGITGLSQLAFARESELLDANDRVADYVGRILPQKLELDQLYVRERSLWRDLEILAWTVVTVLLSREVAVHRETGRLNLRRRPVSRLEPVAVDAALPRESPAVNPGPST